MFTVDSTVSRMMRVKPLEKELDVVADNKAISVMFKDAIMGAANGRRTIVYVHTRHETQPYYLRAVITGEYDITCEVKLTPKLPMLYSSKIDIWIDRKNRILISQNQEGEMR